MRKIGWMSRRNDTGGMAMLLTLNGNRAVLPATRTITVALPAFRGVNARSASTCARLPGTWMTAFGVRSTEVPERVVPITTTRRTSRLLARVSDEGSTCTAIMSDAFPAAVVAGFLFFGVVFVF